MRRLLVPVTCAALMAAALPAEAQVYPERIRTVTRVRITGHTEAYQRRDRREEQIERLTRTLHIGPTGELDLGNIAGDIVITRAGGGDTTIEMTKRARAATAEEAREMLQLVQVDVTERGTRAEVKTRYPRGDERPRMLRHLDVTVSYNVSAPEGVRIRATSISGSISVRDIKGDLTLESVSGDIRLANVQRIPKAKTISGSVEIASTTIEGAMDASTISGTLLMRKVRARRLDLSSVSGNVRLEEVECDRVDARSISGEVHLIGQLVREGRYDLSSHSGEVRVIVSGNVGFEVEARSFSGTVRSDIPLTLRGSTGRGRATRALRGTYGDGSALLDLTTFSGSVVITKR